MCEVEIGVRARAASSARRRAATSSSRNAAIALRRVSMSSRFIRLRRLSRNSGSAPRVVPVINRSASKSRNGYCVCSGSGEMWMILASRPGDTALGTHGTGASSTSTTSARGNSALTSKPRFIG